LRNPGKTFSKHFCTIILPRKTAGALRLATKGADVVQYGLPLEFRRPVLGRIVPVPPVTPILGVLYRDYAIVEDTLIWVEKLIGDIGLASDEYEFSATNHYESEMGSNLKRRFYVFDDLHDPELLADWKTETNRLEDHATERTDDYRPINLDPGYITGSKLVLASVKGLGHRVYIGRNIYAEATMSYRQGEWIKRDYTFPDFKSGQYDAFFSKARERHLMLLGAGTLA
jgi:hypothetical protein